MIIDKEVMQEVQNKWKTELKERLNDEYYRPMTLNLISDGQNPASAVYLRNKLDMCREIGIPVNYIWRPEFDETQLLKLIDEIDNSNNQILIQMPLSNPAYIDLQEIFDRIPDYADVDGMGYRPAVIPPVANGIRYFLRNYNREKIPVDFSEGDLAVVIGRSPWVGMPIAKMLSKDFNLTVVQAHSHTSAKMLDCLIYDAKIVVSCTGQHGVIPAEKYDNKTLVIDVGTNRVDGKLVGDIKDGDKEDSWYVTPVPGGVGPLTVLGLMDNSVTLSEITQ